MTPFEVGVIPHGRLECNGIRPGIGSFWFVVYLTTPHCGAMVSA